MRPSLLIFGVLAFILATEAKSIHGGFVQDRAVYSDCINLEEDDSDSIDLFKKWATEFPEDSKFLFAPDVAWYNKTVPTIIYGKQIVVINCL